MALEAIVFPQDPFSCSSIRGWGFNCEFDSLDLGEQGYLIENLIEEGDVSTLSSEANGKQVEMENKSRKRRRTKSCKNKEEVENQRITHIAVERNRRKQMNEYLSILRSLMPSSYAQRGDQASIVGGAINFVKELEQTLQTLEVQKQIKDNCTNNPSLHSSPFSSFFIFPQYSSSINSISQEVKADIEVTMIESHVNLKIQLQKQPRCLLKLIMGLHSHMLTILHLNMTTANSQTVLYSFSLKVEDNCQLTSVDEIVKAVYQMILRMQYGNVAEISSIC